MSTSPHTALGALPARMKVLYITTLNRTGRWLAEAFAVDSAAEIQLEEAVGVTAGISLEGVRTDEETMPVEVDPVSTVSDATVTTTALHSSDVTATDEQTPYRVTELVRRAGKFRFVTDCLQHALVARGRTHAAVDTIMSPWDVAALVPCVREAGGVARPLNPDAESVVYGGSLVTAGSEALLDEVRAILRPDGLS